MDAISILEVALHKSCWHKNIKDVWRWEPAHWEVHVFALIALPIRVKAQWVIVGKQCRDCGFGMRWY